jgi:hypothetical protein
MPDFEKITERPSLYDHLEEMGVSALLQAINQEDQKSPRPSGQPYRPLPTWSRPWNPVF